MLNKKLRELNIDWKTHAKVVATIVFAPIAILFIIALLIKYSKFIITIVSLGFFVFMFFVAYRFLYEIFQP